MAGNGQIAARIAEALLLKELPVVLVTPDPSFSAFFKPVMDNKNAHLLKAFTETFFIHCGGYAGNFEAILKRHDETISLDCSFIVIAEENHLRPNFPLYGLTQAPHVISISDLKKGINPTASSVTSYSSVKTAVFLTGLVEESYPETTEAVMKESLKLQSEMGIKSYILTRNLKVGSDNLEALYRKTRDAGVVYVKFTDMLPDCKQEDKRVVISFIDEITRKPFSITADLTIVDEAIQPSAYLKDLSRILKLNTDEEGFIQSDNVHRLSVFTNRKGILASGGSRAVLLPSAWTDEVNETLVTIFSLMNNAFTTNENKAMINKGDCVKCLTCLRLCPYNAVMLNTRPEVVPESCERCGICSAECPGKAIVIEDLEVSAVSKSFDVLPEISGESSPFLIAFCCSRSAGRAKELARLSGFKLPERLSVVEVPCSGSISQEYILSAFQKKADGVLIFTCHKGNCHSERGNILALQRAVQFKVILKRVGIDPARLLLKTIAANMASEFADTVSSFEKQIHAEIDKAKVVKTS